MVPGLRPGKITDPLPTEFAAKEAGHHEAEKLSRPFLMGGILIYFRNPAFGMIIPDKEYFTGDL